MIPVTKPFLPDKARLYEVFDQIFERNWLTNHGPVSQELEKQLCAYLEIPHLLFLGNGTLALQIAIKALDLTGEVITTPFSYVATTSAIVWEGLTPVFVDIDPLTFNIDPTQIEARITEKTSAILATHVFGNPCDVIAIEAIAQAHQLSVIYDGAHAFGTTFMGQSLFNYGDLCTASFHATKLFHTVEGGAIVTQNEALAHRIGRLRNFGHTSSTSFEGVGINGKNSEFHAAVGLVNLGAIDEILARRKALCEHYDSLLKGCDLKRPALQYPQETCYNHAYYPVVFPDEASMLQAQQALLVQNIHARRYFYPSLSTLDYVDAQPCPIAVGISTSVLCLPLYHSLQEEEVERIARIVQGAGASRA